MDLLLDDDYVIINAVADAIVELAIPVQHEDENVERQGVVRNRNYVEEVIPNYEDHQFREHFWMSRRTFQNLLNQIGQQHQGRHRIILLEKKLLFTIWILSKPESFLAASDRFVLAKSSGHGQPGRMHGARVFRLSPLYNRLTDVANPLLPEEYHLIGDSAYPLLRNLMKPYQDNGHLTPAQIVFNTKLSSVRSTIERAFGLLKVKFRRLKYLDVNTPNTAVQIIYAACIIHNFILLQNNDDDNYNVEEIHIEYENLNEYEGIVQEKRVFAEIRQHLVNICTII
ncbi:hypothetical protein MML48_10g00001245 [Holotrichia oblita]|uniref:Uncharacterized protein n=1 Tax=Holotrichia oblita TaxID=644536 RepID=A0ACB9SQ39_HOLOL|nr:hypothetical protein MML48_10g00001245 [Holotrichia oblita]